MNYEAILAVFESGQRKHARGDLHGALTLYQSIIDEKPDLEEVHNNKGVVLKELARLEEALSSFDRAIQINPDLGESYNNKGAVLNTLGRPVEALANLDNAIRLDPTSPDAHNNRGVALRKLNRLSEALDSCNKAISLCPTYGEAWSNRGLVLAALQQSDLAAASFDRAVSLLPDHADTLLNGALAFGKKGRFGEAKTLLERVARVEPNHKSLLFGMAFEALQQCDWSTQNLLRPRLAAECATGKSIVSPLTLLGYLDDPALLRAAATHYLNDLLKQNRFVHTRPALSPHGKIRIAYVSGDFHEHATAYLTADLFEHHDRSRFEVYGISFGPDDSGEMRSRLKRAFDQFHDVRSYGDAEVVQLLRKLEVDIAIDLKGFTFGERPGIFAARAAPIQVNYLGYPGTMGADCWDYIIADPTVLPRSEQPYYAEHIVHLGCCYQATDPARRMDPMPTRRSQGLPETGFVFCCFNNHWKISEPVFILWMRLLSAVPDSVLWLAEGSATDTLRHEASARGVDPQRLVFAPPAKQAAHLARLSLADIVLDTLPYNAHTTASDALWAGVPIITCRGKSFAGRVAASILHAIELPELITEDAGTYESLALKLALDSACLRSVRGKLSAKRHTATLFDGNIFRHNLERAFATMMDKARRGEAPAGFDVAI